MKFIDALNCETIYNSYYPINEFYSYCKGEVSTENIEFLFLVRTLNPDLGRSPYDLFPRNMVSESDRARYIYLQYVSDQSPRVTVNLPFNIKGDLDTAYNNNRLTRNSYGAAHENIKTLTESDTWQRFLQKTEAGREISRAEGARFGVVAQKGLHNIFYGSDAYNAAKAARSVAFNLPPAPVLAAPVAAQAPAPAVAANPVAAPVNPVVPGPVNHPPAAVHAHNRHHRRAAPPNFQQIAQQIAAPPVPPLPANIAAIAARIRQHNGAAQAHAVPAAVPAPASASAAFPVVTVVASEEVINKVRLVAQPSASVAMHAPLIIRAANVKKAPPPLPPLPKP